MKITTTLLLALLVAGCATGFDRTAVREMLADKQTEASEEAIRKELSKRPPLRFPIKVAVHMTAENYRREHRGGKLTPADNWRWTVEDRDLIESWAEKLRQAGVVSDMFVMSEMVSNGHDLEKIRLAAAKHGADAVLVVRGVVQVDRYVNPLSALNVFIVPGWFAYGSHRDALVVLKGAMWDLRHDFLYLSVDAEGEGAVRAPTFVIDSADAIEPAKEQALEAFGQELVRRMTNLKPRR
jgi:hypothetical protein